VDNSVVTLTAKSEKFIAGQKALLNAAFNPSDDSQCTEFFVEVCEFYLINIISL
jgi:hypothetical protein